MSAARREAEAAEKAQKETADKARLVASEKARKEAEAAEKARKEAADKGRLEAAKKARREAKAAEKARKEAAEKAWLEAEAALTVLSPDSAMAWTGHIGREVLEAVRNKFSLEPEEALTNQVFIIFIKEVM